MKIGDEVYVHGYVDEIRKGTYVDIVIIRNKGGYFGTDASEVILADRKTEPTAYADGYADGQRDERERWERMADRKTEPTHDLRTETHECVKDTHDKTESTICDFCRYYNSNIPCGSTPSACKEADKFAEEFVNGLKDLRIEADRKTEPSNSEKPNNYEPKTCDNCKLKGSTKWCDNQVVCRAYQPKTEPQTQRSACDTCQWYNSGIPCGVEPSVCKREVEDEPQTEDADCDKCIWSVCNYNKAFAFEDEPQTERSE